MVEATLGGKEVGEGSGQEENRAFFYFKILEAVSQPNAIIGLVSVESHMGSFSSTLIPNLKSNGRPKN